MKNRSDSFKTREMFGNLANQIEQTAKYVRYADRPWDLGIAITQLVQMARRLQIERDRWLDGPKFVLWPRLWERYL